jgi:hypothetical protein
MWGWTSLSMKARRDWRKSSWDSVKFLLVMMYFF